MGHNIDNRKSKTPYRGYRAQGGFTLIELAIGIIVLSVILAPLFGIAKKQADLNNIRLEEAVNQRVIESLALYLQQNGAYPCPAGPALAQGDPNFGVAQPNLGGGINAPDCLENDGVIEDAITGGGPPRRVYIGALPVFDLGLPYQFAANSAGFKYIYAVTGDLTDPSEYDGVGKLQIVDRNGEGIIDPLDPGEIGAPFVIVNPGEDGKGAYPIDGIVPVLACGITALDSENCNEDLRFVDAQFAAFEDPNASNHYDDSVHYTPPLEKSTFWIERPGTGVAGGVLEIVNRNMGNVGIGNVTSPTDKMHVFGGDVLIQYNSTTGTGGNIIVGNDINAGANVRADGNITADQRIMSSSFVVQ